MMSLPAITPLPERPVLPTEGKRSSQNELSETIAQIRSSRTLLSDTFWSFAGNLLSVFSGLAVVKVTTSLIPAQEYGRAGLVLGVVGLLTLFLVNPLQSAHLRIYFDHLHQGSIQRFARRFRIILLWTGLVSVMAYACIAAVNYRRGMHLYLEMLLPAALLLFVQPYFTATANYLEAQRKYRSVATANSLLKAAQVPVLVLLLALSFSGSAGLVVSQACANIAVIVSFRSIYRKTDRSESVVPVTGANANAFKSFGAWLYAANLFAWVLSTSDRYLVQHFLPVNQVGVYIMNYGVWSLPYILLNGWLEMIIRSRTYNCAALNQWGVIIKIFKIRILAGITASVIGTVLLYWVGPLIGRLLLGSRYWFGRSLLMSLAIGHIFFVIGNSTISSYIAAKKTAVLALSYFLGGAANFLMNLYLIPRLGILGAGISTLGAYLLWAAFLLLFLRRVFNTAECRTV